MTACVEVLQLLEQGQTSLPPHLAEHVAHCSACQTLLASWPHLQSAGGTVRSLTTPPQLLEKLARIPRLPPACERTVAVLAMVLDQEASEDDRQWLMKHLQNCPGCRGTWEGLATLKQMGAAVTASSACKRKLASVALPQVKPGAKRARLAAAALYIVAGTLALATGQGERWGRNVNQKIETAFFYGRAVVVNRLNWLEKHAQRWLDRTQEFARDSLSQAFEFWRASLGQDQQNPERENHVRSHEEEGPS